jgi:hypothetical protein
VSFSGKPSTTQNITSTALTALISFLSFRSREELKRAVAWNLHSMAHTARWYCSCRGLSCGGLSLRAVAGCYFAGYSLPLLLLFPEILLV